MRKKCRNQPAHDGSWSVTCRETWNRGTPDIVKKPTRIRAGCFTLPRHTGGRIRTRGPVYRPFPFRLLSWVWITRLDIHVKLPANTDRVSVLGTADRNLKMIREALGVTLTIRDGKHPHPRRPGGGCDCTAGDRPAGGFLGLDGQGTTRAEVLNIIADESSNLAGHAVVVEEDEEKQARPRGVNDRGTSATCLDRLGT
jgi:hypothetical protein